MAYQMESTVLSYDSTITATSDGYVTADSEQSTEVRYIHGITLYSSISDFTAPAAAATEEYELGMQLGFNSQWSHSGVIACLANSVTVTQQAAVTPAPAAVNGAKSLDFEFSTPIKWAEGVTITLLLYAKNTGPATIQAEAQAVIRYQD